MGAGASASAYGAPTDQGHGFTHSWVPTTDGLLLYVAQWDHALTGGVAEGWARDTPRGTVLFAPAYGSHVHASVLQCAR